MSDSDTTDSDSGIRFKTASTRYKSESSQKPSSSRRRSREDDHSRRRESDSRRSDHGSRHGRSSTSNRSKSRSRSRDRRRDSSRRSDRDRDRDSKRHRSRSRSHGRSSRRSSPDNHRAISSSSTSKSTKPEETRPISADRAKVEATKILDISTSSLSSQDDHLTKEPDDHFGPALPPALLPSKPTTSNASNEHEEPEVLSEVIGPALPPHLCKKAVEKHEPSGEDNSRVIGPALPANFVPPADVAGSSESELSPFSEEEPAGDDDDDDDFIGPMPGASSSRSHLELEQRALEMKLKRLDEGYDAKTANVTSREDWMLELPDVRKVSDMGLGARQFRTREKLEMGDRSVWTDTPSDRERKKAGHPSKETTKTKADREEEQEMQRNAERDKQQEEMVKRHKKKHKRDKSLLDLHQKKVKKDKKDKEKSSEPTRRPFDRNVDLHANRFDEAQKKAIFKKAQLLDTRFSSGASKFL